MNNQILLTATLICVGLVAVFLVISIISASKNREVSKWNNRLLHLAGMAAAVLNGIRVTVLYADSRGVMVAANVIVFFSLLVSLIRAERGEPETAEDDNTRY